jgi:Tfp pilus assembly protein PilF
MLDQIKILLGLYYQPVRAMSTMLDSGSLAFAIIAAIAVSAALGSVTQFAPVALIFVPVAVIAIASWTGRGSPGVALHRDFAPMLACVSMAWTAAHLPILWVPYAAPDLLLPARIASGLYFLILAAVAVRTIAGALALPSIVTAVGALGAAVGGYFAWDQIGGLSYLFFSPFVLFMLYPLIRSNVDAVSGGLRSRQNFRRNLEASALNPHDADAQYQLGLIYQDRRNYTEAISRFEKAVAIDKTDPHPLYQLGRIAREQGRLQDALRILNQTHALDQKHSSGEVWRDLGATNVELGNPDIARQQLEPYVEWREYDPQGLYWLGRCYKDLNRPADARSAFERAVEAAQTSPPHLKRQNARWSSQSKSELRGLPK